MNETDEEITEDTSTDTAIDVTELQLVLIHGTDKIKNKVTSKALKINEGSDLHPDQCLTLKSNLRQAVNMGTVILKITGKRCLHLALKTGKAEGLESIHTNKTWTLVYLPPLRKAVGSN